MPVSLSSPSFVGSYRLLNVVNTGQNCRIWQAYHDGQHQMYGVKILLEKCRKDREQVGYLKQEYTVGQKVVHKRIIRMYEYGVDRGLPYLVMEWFPAPNMKSYIRQGMEKIAHLLPQIIERAAEALAYLNHEGWVHRDVKPDNFLVSDDGDVKLIDLALAVRAKRGLGKLLSVKSKIQGTRSYMSPEQIRGQALDQRADVYSFACTLFEFVTGRTPFTGANANELLQKHLKAAVPPVEAFNKNVAPDFSKLLRRSMAKDPAERPNSVGDMLREIKASNIFQRLPKAPAGAAKAAERQQPPT